MHCCIVKKYYNGLVDKGIKHKLNNWYQRFAGIEFKAEYNC